MGEHPDYYTALLNRRLATETARAPSTDPAQPLTPAERREMELHLSICPQCSHDYASLLMSHAPRRARRLLRDVEDSLTADSVKPYLRDLAQAIQARRPLTGFQRLVWRFVCQDRETLGRFRLIEADVWAHSERADV
jgi:hypothetical protein